MRCPSVSSESRCRRPHTPHARTPKQARDGVTKRAAPLPLVRVRRFARRAREYKYRFGEYTSKADILEAVKRDDPDGTVYGMIESKMRKEKRHRCTGEQDFKFCCQEE